MTVSIYVHTLKFSDGTTIDVQESDTVLLVGPNNAGKSATIRAVQDAFISQNPTSPVVSVTKAKNGSPADFSAWLSANFRKTIEKGDEHYLLPHQGRQLTQNLNIYWQGAPHIIGKLFCMILSAEERTSLVKAPQNIKRASEPATHPIQVIAEKEGLAKQITNQFKKAFGADLVLNYAAGGELPLHVGERPSFDPGEDRISESYAKKVELLPRLEEQGDGMKSFAGMLLSVSTGKENVLLIDEPEAFLHPPQARLIGRMLIEDKQEGRQLFVATHSGDFLRGVLDARIGNRRILRIHRDGNINYVRELKHEQITELWKDPLLRYSNILDGLFHEKVVVCEGDSDCRFYSAVIDANYDIKGEDVRRPDIMFTHCGGKARLPLVIRSLRAVDVPVVAVTDFDVLNNEQPLRQIYEAAGGAWEEIVSDWKLVKTTIEAKRPELPSVEIVEGIQEALKKVKGNPFPNEVKREIEDCMAKASPWANAKLVGKAILPGGQPYEACERLLGRLEAAGIFVVDVGILERFVPQVGNHGPSWVNTVLSEKDLKSDPNLQAARSFVARFT